MTEPTRLITVDDHRRLFRQWCADGAEVPTEVVHMMWLEDGDCYLPVPRGLYAGLYLHIRPRTRVEQSWLTKHAELRTLGIWGYTVESWRNAVFILQEYLDGTRARM